MKDFLLVALLSLQILFVSADDVGNANIYVDQVLDNLRKDTIIRPKIDPLIVPDVTTPTFNLKDARVDGLLSIARHGDCTVHADFTSFKVAAHLGVDNIKFQGKYDAKAAFFWVHGSVEGYVTKIVVNLDLSMNMLKGTFNMNGFKVSDFGEIKLTKTTGMSFVLNWALKLIMNSILNKWKPRITQAIEVEVAKVIRENLDKIKFPNPLN